MESSSNVAGNIGRCSVRLHCVLARRNEGTCHVVCLCSMSYTERPVDINVFIFRTIRTQMHGLYRGRTVWVAFVIAELNSIRASNTSSFISLQELRKNFP
jgi:hypothetical protein